MDSILQTSAALQAIEKADKNAGVLAVILPRDTWINNNSSLDLYITLNLQLRQTSAPNKQVTNKKHQGALKAEPTISHNDGREKRQLQGR